MFAVRPGFPGQLNEPPSLADDTMERSVGQGAKVRVSWLSSNDLDPENDPMSLQVVDNFSVAGGTVQLDNGWLLYLPPLGFEQNDAFSYTMVDAAGNQSSAWVTVLVTGTGPGPSHNLLSITPLPNGHMLITFVGVAGRAYTIEWTEELTPPVLWNRLTTQQAGLQGIIEVEDPTDPPPPQRIYRTVYP